jgi:Protein of unknown function (DUF2524)
MAYHKDKQQAFQAAQRGVEQALHIYEDMVKSDANYGQELHHLRQEVNEAYEQINNALEVASETQREQLEKFQRDLQSLVQEVNQVE